MSQTSRVVRTHSDWRYWMPTGTSDLPKRPLPPAGWKIHLSFERDRFARGCEIARGVVARASEASPERIREAIYHG